MVYILSMLVISFPWPFVLIHFLRRREKEKRLEIKAINQDKIISVGLNELKRQLIILGICFGLMLIFMLGLLIILRLEIKNYGLTLTLILGIVISVGLIGPLILMLGPKEHYDYGYLVLIKNRSLSWFKANTELQTIDLTKPYQVSRIFSPDVFRKSARNPYMTIKISQENNSLDFYYRLRQDEIRDIDLIRKLPTGRQTGYQVNHMGRIIAQFLEKGKSA